MMPTYNADLLSDKDLEDIVAYLSQRGGEMRARRSFGGPRGHVLISAPRKNRPKAPGFNPSGLLKASWGQDAALAGPQCAGPMNTFEFG
jgi:hypothetical protein